MKVYSFKKVVYTALTLSLLSSAAQGGRNYAKIFTPDIYDQSEVLKDKSTNLPRKFTNEQEREKVLLDHLKQQKEKALEDKCIKIIDEKISIRQKQYEEAIKRSQVSSGVKLASRLLTLLFRLGPTVSPTLKMFDINLDFDFINDAFEVASQKIGSKFSTPLSKENLSEKLDALYWDLTEWKDGLNQEHIKDLEKKYILNKEKIDKRLQKEIERALIEVRDSDCGYGVPTTTRFIENALNLPLQAKCLLKYPHDVDKSRRRLLKKFDKNEHFSNYGTELREVLKGIVTRIAINSIAPDDSPIPLRECHYWLGDPSAGKSSAAKEISEFLKLPSFEAPSDCDLNTEGFERWSPSPNIGLLAEALMTPYSSKRKADTNEEKAYTNGFLIFDDLDRIPSHLTEPFLLRVLDLENKEFRSKYFGTSIKNDRLNIIITANSKLRDDEACERASTNSTSRAEGSSPLNDSNKMNAVGSRVIQTYFRPLSDTVIKKNLDKFLKNLCVHNHLPEIFWFERKDNKNIVFKYDQNFIQKYELNQAIKAIRESLFKHLGYSLAEDENREFCYTIGINQSLREEKTQLKIAINDIANNLSLKGKEWLKEAEGEDKTEEEQLTLYKQAAVVGNTKACLKLGALLKNDNPDIAHQWYVKAKDSSTEANTQYEAFIKESKRRFLQKPNDALVKKLLTFLPNTVNIKIQGFFTTPFHVAAAQNNTQLLKALLNNQDQSKMADFLIQLKDSNENTPFHVAAENGNIRILWELLNVDYDGAKQNAAVNQKGKNGCTPMMLAVSKGNYFIVKLLQLKGADMLAMNATGRTVLQEALMKRNQNPQTQNYIDIVEYLLTNSPPIVDSMGQETNLRSHATYKIINKWGPYNRAISVTSQGVLAVNNVDNTSYKLFRFLPSQWSGYYFIENVRNKKVINVYDAHLNGSTVTAEDNDNHCESHRLFRLIKRWDDGYYIENKENGRVLCTHDGVLPWSRSIMAGKNNDWCYQYKVFQIQ